MTNFWKSVATVATLTAGLSLGASAANATIYTFFDDLNGSNEIPPNGTTAMGTLTGTYDDVTKIFDFTYDITSGALTGDLTVGHIHGAATEFENANVVLDLNSLDDVTFVGLGGISEGNGPWPQVPTYNATIDLDSAGGIALLGAFGETTASFEQKLLDEMLYINLHTQLNPEGELRAQFFIVDADEPAMVGLLGLGLIGIAMTARRRRRA